MIFGMISGFWKVFQEKGFRGISAALQTCARDETRLWCEERKLFEQKHVAEQNI